MSQINKIKSSWLESIYKLTILPRARKKQKLLSALLKPKSSLFEIGSGNCGLAFLLQGDNFLVTASDIIDVSFYDEIKPIIFDGKKLNLADNSFDYVLIITVLHHTTNQIELLTEAKRLAKSVIVMEDVYTNSLGKAILKFTDSLVNLEFKGHPHTNRTYKEWEILFNEFGFEIVKSVHTRTLGFFRQVVYELKC